MLTCLKSSYVHELSAKLARSAPGHNLLDLQDEILPPVLLEIDDATLVVESHHWAHLALRVQLNDQEVAQLGDQA